MRKDRRRTRVALAWVALAACMALVAGCAAPTTTGGSGAPATKGPIRVGSKIDTEGSLLGQMIVAMLGANGFTVEDKTRTGATKVVRDALISGQVDIYPEYTGNVFVGFHPEVKVDPSVPRDPVKSYTEAAAIDLRTSKVVWLKPASANNTWAVAVPKAFSDTNGIKTMEDWAAYINAGKPVKVVGSQEFFSSAAAMPAFEAAYGFKLSSAQVVALATGDTAVAEKAAAQGTDGANASMAYGTDGTISALDLVVLEDTKNVQPVYQPAPTMREETAKKYPEIATILDPVFAKLDLTTLQNLNGQIDVEGKDAKTVATDWLKSEGFLK